MPSSASNSLKTEPQTIKGVLEPRIWTKGGDLPSKGQEMIDFCEKIGYKLLPWQELLAMELCKIKPNGKWRFAEAGVIISRQNGKSTFLALRILTGMFLWGEKLQVHTAHKLTTSSEIFWKIDEIIQSNPELLAEFVKKYETKGSQEIRTQRARYLVRANNSAARGIAAVDTIHMDEVREYQSDEVWSSLRFTQLSSENPQLIVYSNAGDANSVVLNKLRERGIAASEGSNDQIGWFEWSAEPGCAILIDGEPNWDAFAQANPSLGHTLQADNLQAAMHDDESIIRTELLCQWVNQINPAINPSNWEACGDPQAKLDTEQTTWMAIDLSPDRKAAALIAAQQKGDKFIAALLQTWTNVEALDDKALANDIATWVRKYPTESVAFSRQTAGAVAARLAPAGISTVAVDGALYGQSCDEMLSAITSGRLIHPNQQEFSKQVLSAVKLPFKDGGWYLGRKVSNATICAAVGLAMVSHFATRPESEVDIYIG